METPSEIKKSVFIVTKPLQYFNSKNILDLNPKVLLLVDLFSEAEPIFKKIKTESSYWDESHFFKKFQYSFIWIFRNKRNISNLYIPTDIGLQMFFFLKMMGNLNIYIYEEGIGNYTSIISEFKKQPLLNRMVYKIFNLQTFFGGSVFVKGTILYQIEKHRRTVPVYKKQRIPFKKNFIENLKLDKDLDLFFPQELHAVVSNLKGKNVLLYITSWKINPNIDKYLKEFPDFFMILKPHPHIREITTKDDFNLIVQGLVPVEILILKIKHYCKKLVVFHENSSSALYLKNDEILKLINIGNINSGNNFD